MDAVCTVRMTMEDYKRVEKIVKQYENSRDKARERGRKKATYQLGVRSKPICMEIINVELSVPPQPQQWMSQSTHQWMPQLQSQQPQEIIINRL